MPTPNLIGQQIHHYEILSPLGGGGMGVVYKAKDTKLGRMVALKFLAPQLTSDPGLKKRFVQEAKAASALDHPNIGTIFEINETDDGQLFIAMAYYEGDTLKDKIAQGPIPTEQAIDYASQIAKGLAKAHEADIVHRDIKPANIIITKDDTVKIVDFGLAKMSGETQLTKTGSTIGTIAYMSPEQLKGEDVDHRTDIWSLGVVLYEMVMGERPYKGEYEHQIIYQVLHDEVDLEKVPKEASYIVERMLQKNPNDRFQHLSELKGVDASQGENRSFSYAHNAKGRQPFGRGIRMVVIGAILGVLIVASVFQLIRETAQTSEQGSTGSVHTKLTFSGDSYFPAISPDGELLAYVTLQFNTSSFTLFLQEIPGGQPVELFSGSMSMREGLPHIDWSPDGSMLGVSYWDDNSAEKGFQLALFSKLGKFIRTVPISYQKESVFRTQSSFCWSPGGEQIAHAIGSEIRIVDLNTFEEYFIKVGSNDEPVVVTDWSPSGKFLLWIKQESDPRVIGVVDTDTGKEQAVLTTNDRVFFPKWGKNGESVYFLKSEINSRANRELWKIDVAKHSGKPVGNPRLHDASMKSTFAFSVSPESNQLVYFSDRGHAQIWGHILDSTGINLVTKRLTSLTTGKGNISMSPDGKQVAFMMEGVSGNDVYTLSMDEPRELVQHTFVGTAEMRWKRKLDWNKEGDKLVFVTREGINKRVINVLDLKTGQITPLVEGGEWSVSWGNQNEILYEKDKMIRLIHSTTLEDSLLFEVKDAGQLHYPSLSPNGLHLVYHNWVEDGPQEIWVYSLENQRHRQIYSSEKKTDIFAHVGWSEDSRSVYMFREVFLNPPDSMSIDKIDVESGVVSEYETLPGFSLVDMSPDGSRFTTLKWELTSDIYLIENFDPEVE